MMIKHLRLSGAALVCAGLLAVAGSAAGAGVASASTRGGAARVVRHEATAHPASTVGFIYHAGLALYAFDHFIYQPYKAGDLHGFTHKVTEIKAALAAVFVYHEMKAAISDVKGSKLAFLAVPITALVAKLASLKSGLSSGNASAVTGINDGLGSIGQQAAGKGFSVKPITTGL